LKLFYSPSTCSFVPHVAFLETNLNVDLILARAGHMTPDFISINPKRRVPVLVINDTEIITECLPS
jgi:glutathione S-transferase